MDIYCRHCGEPWENDSLHAEAEERHTSYAKVAADFRANGCAALSRAFGIGACCSEREASPVIGALTDLLGDDMDGLASMLDDADAMGAL